MATLASRERLERLPGWEIVSEGLADAAAGRITPFACAVSIASPRLRRAGLLDPELFARRIAEPERTLYRLVCGEPVRRSPTASSRARSM